MSGSNTIIIAGEEYSTETSELELSGRGLVSEDIKDIGKIKNLSALYMPENGLTDISALKPLSELNTLYLQYNSISDIEPLAGLDKITDLKLNNNCIENISALKNLKGLKKISLQNNKISDITVLQSLAGMEKIYLDGNPVSLEDIEALRKVLPECEIECGDIAETVQSEKNDSNITEETVTVKSEKSKRPVILAAAAMAVIAVIAAAAVNLTRNADDFSVSETESIPEITETAAVSSETTAPETTTAADESEAAESTTAMTTTVPETTTPETSTTPEITTTPETATTPETTTAPPFTSYIPVKYNYSVPDIVPLYMREEYNKNPKQYFSTTTFDIDDEELLYLTVNADFIRCHLLFGSISSWSANPDFKSEMIRIKFDSDNDVYYVWSTGVSFRSFIDYASTVFTQDYIDKLTMPHHASDEYIPEIPLIVNVNDELYYNMVERGTNPGHEETIYYVQTKTENKATVVRESVQLGFYEELMHTYYYIDLVKTPDGWRYDGFPMFDEYYYDVHADGTPAWTRN